MLGEVTEALPQMKAGVYIVFCYADDSDKIILCSSLANLLVVVVANVKIIIASSIQRCYHILCLADRRLQ